MLRLLKGLLWFVCAFHIIVGLGLNIVPGMALFMASYYGAEVKLNPELEYILKPLGAFMFTLGVICVSAALNPLRYRPVVYGFAVLFIIRGFQRLVFAQEILDNFSIAASRNLTNMAFFLLLGVALIVFVRLSREESSTTAEPASG